MKLSAHFTPGEDIEPIVIGLIQSAKRSIRLQGYGFTSAGIAAALVYAHGQGVDVGVILDGPNEFEKTSQAGTLIAAGVPVLFDRSHAISHNKVLIIDANTVVTGSYNWTDGARRHNAENIVVIRDTVAAVAYLTNWDNHSLHAQHPGTKPLRGALEVTGGAVESEEYGDAEPI